MAFVLSQDDEDQQKKTDGTPILDGQSADFGSSPQSGDPSKGGQPTSSGSFVNLQKYIDANQDQSPSSLISQKIGQEGDVARSDLSKNESDFNTQAKAGAADYDQSLIDRAYSDPAAFVKNADDVAAFSKQRDNAYKGPNKLSDLAGYQGSEGRNVVDETAQTQSEPGQFALLQRYAGQPTYSHGEQALDQLIMANSPQTQKDFATLQSNYGNLGNEYTQAEQNAANAAQARKDQATQSANAVQTGGNSAESAVQSAVGQRVSDLAKQQASQLSTIQAAIHGHQAAPLGLSSGFVGYGIDPSSYLKQEAAPVAGSVATPEEQARYAALNQLLGTTNTYLPYANQAGTYDPAAAATFDTPGFQGAAKDAQSSYLQQLNSSKVGLNVANQFASVDPFIANDITSKLGADPNLVDTQKYLTNLISQLQPSNGIQTAVDAEKQKIALNLLNNYINPAIGQIDNRWHTDDIYSPTQPSIGGGSFVHTSPLSPSR